MDAILLFKAIRGDLTFAFPGRMKILFCLNQGAGKKRRIDWRGLIQDRIGKEHDAVILELDGEARGHIAEAIGLHRPDRVIAIGGDGTVNLLASIIGGSPIAMGIVPAGSANGLATDLNIPNDHSDALDLALKGDPRPVDAIMIGGRQLCIHLADLGLNARLIKYFDQTPSRGMLTYARLSIKVLFRKERFKVRVKTDRGEFLRSAFMVVLANARKYGTGATINKQGRIDDGSFEVVFVRRFGLSDLWKAIHEKKPFDPKRIEIVSVKEVDIYMRRSVHFQVDGDHKGRINHVHARILPGHLNIIHAL